MKVTSRLARGVGVASLAAILVTLVACGTPAEMNEDYLVLTTVEGIDCSTVADPALVSSELQATADFVEGASPKQTNDILALNEGLSSLDPLTAALSAKIESCGAPQPTTAGGDEASITLSDELKALLDAANVPLEEFSCEKIVTETGGTVINGTYTLFVNTLLEVDEGNLNLRQWSDALSTVLKGSTPEEMRTWLNRAICEEPVIGVALAHLFAHLRVGDVSVLSLQTSDWLKPFEVDASQINNLVAQYVPLTVWRLQNLGKQDIPEDIYVAALKANHEYQELASRLVFLLSRYQLAQVMSIDSTHHYHLVDGGLTADNIPEVEVSNEVDSRPALVFYLTEKTACKPISVLAFNVGDKRPMLGSVPETCEELLPPPSAPETPTTPDTPVNPPQGKNPGLDPEAQENNKPGGGGVAPVQTDPVGPPAAGDPGPVYTPPAPVQTPAPPVQPQPGPQPTVNPGSGGASDGEIVAPDPGPTCSAEGREFGLC